MGELERLFLQHVGRAVRAGIPQMKARRQASAPRDSGDLAASIDIVWKGRQGNRFRVEATQDADMAPHGQIINNPRGERIQARPGGALGPFQHAGQTMFRRSVEQSTEHKGWWDDYPWVEEFENAVRPHL